MKAVVINTTASGVIQTWDLSRDGVTLQTTRPLWLLVLC